jgi:L-malate glycosyltransferase
MLNSNTIKSPILVCHIISGDLWAGAEAQVYNLLLGFSVSKNFKIFTIVFNNGILTEKLRLSNIETIVIDEKKTRPIAFIWKIYKILKLKQPNIIHVHGYKEAFLSGIAAKFCRINKIIRTHHGKGIIDGNIKQRLLEFLIAKFFIKFSISVSTDLKKNLIFHNLGNDNTISVIHNGINIEKICFVKNNKEIREELGIEQHTLVIGTLGRMTKVKGHKYFLEGAQRVCKNNNTTFVIAGDGPLKKDAIDFIQTNNIENSVKIIGFRNDPYDILNMFDIFTLTSLHEGVPMVLLEAMCLAKPIIATNVGGIPEICIHGENAILIDPMDSNGFTDACLKLIQNTALRYKIGCQARKDLYNKHTIGHVVEMVENIYQKVI